MTHRDLLLFQCCGKKMIFFRSVLYLGSPFVSLLPANKKVQTCNLKYGILGRKYIFRTHIEWEKP